jgi:phosphoribosylformimino-5-aminoimidazole carboxamide ribotide isomerase
MVKKMLKNSRLSVIVSGGISSLVDIYKLRPLSKRGLTGIIIGKALYEGKFTLREAIKLA